jgi:DNA polymerase-1
MINKLILVDGLACIYRSFYAIKGLSTSEGVPVNAVYGFILQLESVIREIKPSHIGVMFDGGLNDDRMALLPEYKAQRPPMPDDLRNQLPLINEFLDEVGMFWFLGEGVEADDAIASLCQQFRNQAEELYILTSDKDMFQLIGDNVKMILPGKDKKILDEGGVMGKTGVSPWQIVEWLAMVGDSSDNISGVPGVGAKTAAKLLDEYGSLDRIIENADSIKREKIRRAILDSRDVLKRNVELIALKNVECGVDESELQFTPHFGAGLESFLTRLDFGSMVDRLKEGQFLR